MATFRKLSGASGDPHSRFHWPRDGVAIRVPPRRSAGTGATCGLIAFAGSRAQPARTVAWDSLATTLPRGSRIVLLVAAEDVSFTSADVPSLTGLRLREALPNLVEERTVGEVGALHVALGQSAAEGRGRTLAVVDRVWLAAMQVHVARAGHRVAAIVPASLAVPLAPESWSLASVASGGAVDSWLRTGVQEALRLPADEASAIAIAKALVRTSARPARLAFYAAPAAGTTTATATTTAAAAAGETGATIAAHLGVPLLPDGGDPFAAWLAGNGPDGGYGPALSLLAFDGGGSSATWKRWRIAAVLALVVVGVQIVGMQWQWAELRHDASGLRQQSSAILTTAFPDTRVVLDAPLQMSRGLATLRASAGRNDPSDFTSTMTASARIFAALPSSALRGADFEAHALKLRFAPGLATAGDERERFVAAAAQEGYVLRFEASANAAGEASATLKAKGVA